MKQKGIIPLIFGILIATQGLAQDHKSKAVSETARLKQRIEQYHKCGCAVTVKLKSGAIYYYVPSHGSEVKHKVGQKTKFAGRLEQVGDEEFWLGKRDFIGHQYLTLRIRYEEVEKLHANLIPNALKSTGEFLFWCILLMPTGACAM